MRRVVLVVLLAALTLPAAVFATGTPPGGEEQTLRVAWWGNPTRDERTLAVIDMYMEMHPNVTIEPETVGWSGYWDRINTQVASGTMPDVMQHDYAYLLQFVDRNLMKDLSPYVSNRTIDLAGVDESFLSGGRVGGRLYGVSLGTNAVCMVYDPAMFRRAGVQPPSVDWTWGDFEEIALALANSIGVKSIPFFATDPKVGFENVIRQTGQSFFSRTGDSLGFSDPALLQEYFDVQLRLLDEGALIDPEVAFVPMTAAEGPLGQGDAWNEFLWSNQVISTVGEVGRPLDIALLPSIDNAKQPGTYLKPSMFFSIPASAVNPDEAASFIDFFVNDLGANDVLLGERGVPIVKTVRDHLKEQVDPVMSDIFDYISLVGNGHASPIDPPDPVGTGEVLKLFRDTTQEVLFGQLSSRAGAAKIIEGANSILADQ